MLSAKYHDVKKISYHYFMADGSEGDAYPDGARWDDIEEERTEAGITPTDYVGPTAMEIWEEAMVHSDHTMMPRRAEDHIADDHSGTAGNPYLQTKYDGKKALRATKP